MHHLFLFYPFQTRFVTLGNFLSSENLVIVSLVMPQKVLLDLQIYCNSLVIRLRWSWEKFPAPRQWGHGNSDITRSGCHGNNDIMRQRHENKDVTEPKFCCSLMRNYKYSKEIENALSDLAVKEKSISLPHQFSFVLWNY